MVFRAQVIEMMGMRLRFFCGDHGYMEFWLLMMILTGLIWVMLRKGLMEIEGLAEGRRQGQSVIDNKRS